MQITDDNIQTTCRVCGTLYDVIQPDPIYQMERWKRICSESCAADNWHRFRCPGSVSATRHLRAPSSAANTRLGSGVPTAERLAAVEKRRQQVATLFAEGKSIGEIARLIGVKESPVAYDLKVLGLTRRTRNLDRTRAHELADAGLPWPQAAKEAGVSHTQFCKWMRESGRKPPSRENKAHLKPTAFALYDKKTSWAEICNTLGIASATLSQWLRKREVTKPVTTVIQQTRK